MIYHPCQRAVCFQILAVKLPLIGYFILANHKQVVHVRKNFWGSVITHA